VKTIKALPKTEEYKEFKNEELSKLSSKLFQMGVVKDGFNFETKLRAEDFCRRRLSYLMYKQHYAESVMLSCEYISHGRKRKKF
jgi:ribosomal protein S4